MKRKIAVLTLAVMLFCAFAGTVFAALPQGAQPITILGVKQLLATEQLYHDVTYDTSSNEWASFSSYLGRLKDNQKIISVFGINVYDTAGNLQPGTNYAAIPPDDTPYIFSIASALPSYNPISGDDYNIYMYDEKLDYGDGSPLGGWRYLSNDPHDVKTKYGFGVYAVFLDAAQPFGKVEVEYNATNKPSNLTLYNRYSYGPNNQEYIDFANYIQQNNIYGTIGEVVQLNAWDSTSKMYVENNSNLAAHGISAPYTIQTQMLGFTVLYMPQVGAPIQLLGDGAAVTTNEGFGYFAFIPPALSFDNTQITLAQGATHGITATTTLAIQTYQKVWASSDTAVATVDANGVVTAVGTGTATITCTIRDLSAEATVTVTEAPTPTPTPTPTPLPSAAISPQTGVYN